MKKPAFWLWLLVAAWPPEIVVRVMGWDIVDPGYLGVLVAWWPVDVLGRLGALGVLIQIGTGGPMARPHTRWRSALAAEVLLGLKATSLALLGLIPAIAALSYLGVDSPEKGLVITGLAGLGLLPATYFFMARLLAPFYILRQGLPAHAALDASARQTHGRLNLFLRLLLPWTALSWALDLGTLVLPDAAALLLAPFSLACGLLALRKADQGLS